MPVLRGSVSFARFRAEAEDGDDKVDVKKGLTRGLKAAAFEPLNRGGRRAADDDERAAGFVHVDDHDATELAKGSLQFGEHLAVGYRIDTLAVPAAAVRRELDRWVAARTREDGAPPSRAERNGQREQIQHELRRRAFPRTRVHDVTWNLRTHDVQIWATSRKVVEEIQDALQTAFGVKLIERAPGVLAQRAGVPEGALSPTAALAAADAEALEALGALASTDVVPVPEVQRG